MAETKKKSIVFVVALIVLAAMIVVVATALSGCSGNDNSADPTPTETAVPEQTAAPAASNGSVGSIGSAASTGSTGGSSAKQPSASSGSSSSSTSGSKDNGGSDRNKLEYILNYGDNVEKGIEKSTDDFVKSLENIGNAYDKGDVEGIANTANDFTKGLGDYLGGIRDTIVP